MTFSFSRNMLTISSRDLGNTKATLIVDGESGPVEFKSGFVGATAAVGPVPPLDGEQTKVQVRNLGERSWNRTQNFILLNNRGEWTNNEVVPVVVDFPDGLFLQFTR
ncbi:hypothetical protein CVV65_13400 [Kyrpidia spormannii]|uniref:Uncharacterized protein n=1 Tax=Kyrpidia spormannii TaxID=2055160 RepID=A0A2K8N8Y2_9BACL|nr:hypothetical protein CVV65_13400 [Kyrpidia spormannii]